MESSDGRLGLAEMYYKLSAAASSRATLDAETMGRLASEEFWDDTAGPAPRAPRGRPCKTFSGTSSTRTVARRTRAATRPDETRWRARACFRTRREARLPRVSSRASRCTRYVSKRARGGGVMATVRARDSIRALGPRRVVTARGCSGGLCRVRDGRRVQDGLRARDVRRRRRLIRSRRRLVRPAPVDSSVDSDETRVLVLEAPDVRACLIHQKLQLINACIRRRKVASVAAFEASEVSKEGPTPLAGTVSVDGRAKGWNDPGDGWEGADDWNDRTDAAGGTGVVDDDIDLTSLLGSDAAPTAKRRGGEEERSSEDTPRGDAGLGESLNPEPVASAARDDDEDVGFETASDDGDGEGLSSDEPAGPPEGVRRPHPAGLRLLRPPHAPLNVPVTQLPRDDRGHDARARGGDARARRHPRRTRASREDAERSAHLGHVRVQGGESRFVPRGFRAVALAERLDRGRRPRGGARRLGTVGTERCPLRAHARARERVGHAVARRAPRVRGVAETAFRPDSRGREGASFPRKRSRPRRCSRSSSPPPRGTWDTSTPPPTARRSNPRRKRSNARRTSPLVRSRDRVPAPRSTPPSPANYNARNASSRERSRSRIDYRAFRDAYSRRSFATPPRKTTRASVKTRRRTGTGKGTAAEDGRLRRASEAAVRGDCEERRAVAALLPPGTDGAGAEAATVAEYVIRVGGGRAQTHRAHVVAAPCFLRVSAADAYPY